MKTDRSHRISLGKKMARMAYKPKLDKMRLPRLAQDEFYSRYSIFDQKTMRKSSNSFYRTRTSDKRASVLQGAESTQDTFYTTIDKYRCKSMRNERVKAKMNDNQIRNTFRRSAQQFRVKKYVKNPAYGQVSQNRKTSLLYVSLI